MNLKLGGYKKPEKFDDVLKLDSNENFVINKKFQQDVISYAKSHADVREYPLGGVEKLVSKLSKYLKVSENMIGVGNGSDQILDLFLVNMASKKTRILTSDQHLDSLKNDANYMQFLAPKFHFRLT